MEIPTGGKKRFSQKYVPCTLHSAVETPANRLQMILFWTLKKKKKVYIFGNSVMVAGNDFSPWIQKKHVF